MAPYGGRVTSEAARFPLQDHLGMTVASTAPGVGMAAVDVTPALHNPNGVVHGAVLFAMVDTAMGAAIMSSLDEGLACASIEVHLRFLRTVSSGRLTAESTVIKGGRRIVQLDSRVTDDTGQLVASASGSFAVISAR
jgi:acyl-CoA thioesterase